MADRRLPALLFDLDGTLVDSIELILSSFRYTFRSHFGAAPPDEAWIRGIGTPLADQIRSLVPEETLVPDMVATYRHYQLAHHDALLREYEGARDTLSLLKARGHPTAVVTSKMEDLAQRALAHVGLAPAIDLVIGVGATSRHKPHPEPVLLALERLEVGARDALFIGDSPHDVAAGNAAGVATVAALWGPFDRARLEAARPTHLLEHVRHLPALVDRLAPTPA